MSSLSVPTTILAATTGPHLSDQREMVKNWRSDECRLTGKDLTDDALVDLAAAAEQIGDASFGRVVESMQAARRGKFGAIPKLAAAPEVLIRYLQHEMIDGWLYLPGTDGHLHPHLVTSIRINDNAKYDKPFLEIRVEADDPTEKRNGRTGRVLSFTAAEVTRKKPADVLLAEGALKETPALKAEYLARLAAYEQVIADGFAGQYRFTGRPLRVMDDEGRYSYKEPNPRTGAKVIHDIAPSEIPPLRGTAPSDLYETPDDADGVGPVPVVTSLRVFDLGTQDFLTVNAADLTEHVYDKSLREKLILPPDQRELLDILTADIDTFVGDVIEGKSAGNVVLAKGIPGVGKTMTAEVYSELIERPLYSIHSGSLGITAPDVRKNLETVFTRAKRWNAVLLLDEADVFVLERGADIAQNAIVAEFLRTMEYFDGLLFMTTNRAMDIDDAILSRCAAVIDYRAPGAADARKVWQVLATNQDITLDPDLLDQLVTGFPRATPRDVKMLLRLALRVAAHRHEELTIDVFARCAMFRGLHYGADDDESETEPAPKSGDWAHVCSRQDVR